MDTEKNIKVFEKELKEDLKLYLRSEKRVDEMLPECPDLEELWPSVRDAYLPDGVREFANYPVVSLGWIMFVGMGLAKYWDDDWEKYSKVGGAELYMSMRDARGYDNMDDYILQDVLGLQGEEAEAVSKMAGECAQRTYRKLLASEFENGTAEAAGAYIDALHQLYLMGIYTELNALGYHLTKMG